MSATANTITVRAATLDDLKTIVDGNETMARVTEDRILDRTTLTAGVREALSDLAKARYFVAERRQEGATTTSVGQLMLTQEWSDWRNGMFWWIQSVFVAEDARRTGVYRALYSHVLDAAKEHGGICGVRLYVERDNVVAQATYASLGMKTCDYNIMEIDFSDT